MYHFISGYTAKVAGTERGVTKPTATFSPCFGGPFLTLHPLKYAKLLKQKMNSHSVLTYLVNTGWVGSNAESGAKRFSLPGTRLIINSILDGSIENSEFEKDQYFNIDIPKNLNGIDANLLNPLTSWSNIKEYHSSAKELVTKFKENFVKYDLGDKKILNGGPI